jgi:hypothetical protein
LRWKQRTADPRIGFSPLTVQSPRFAIASGLGFITAPVPPTFEEAAQRLPERVRRRFPPDAERPKEELLLTIESCDLASFGQAQATAAAEHAAGSRDSHVSVRGEEVLPAPGAGRTPGDIDATAPAAAAGDGRGGFRISVSEAAASRASTLILTAVLRTVVFRPGE